MPPVRCEGAEETEGHICILRSPQPLSVDFILELFNIPPEEARPALAADMTTVSDEAFDRILAGLYEMQTVSDELQKTAARCYDALCKRRGPV